MIVKGDDNMSDIKYININTNELVYQQNGTDYTPVPGDPFTLNNFEWKIEKVSVGAQITCFIKPK